MKQNQPELTSFKALLYIRHWDINTCTSLCTVVGSNSDEDVFITARHMQDEIKLTKREVGRASTARTMHLHVANERNVWRRSRRWLASEWPTRSDVIFRCQCKRHHSDSSCNAVTCCVVDVFTANGLTMALLYYTTTDTDKTTWQGIAWIVETTSQINVWCRSGTNYLRKSLMLHL